MLIWYAADFSRGPPLHIFLHVHGRAAARDADSLCQMPDHVVKHTGLEMSAALVLELCRVNSALGA